MLKRGLLCVALAVCLTGPAYGVDLDTPSGKWWRMPRVAEKLDLDPGMQSHLDELFYKNRQTLIELKNELEKERLKLDYLLDQRAVDEQEVSRQYRRLDEVRSQLANAQLDYLLEVRKIIGYDRYQQLKQLYHETKSRENRRN